MAQQQVAGLAALIVLAFVVAALSACASSAQPAAVEPTAAVAEPIALEAPGVAEFHDASIGADSLRSRL
ncbi:MAG: hypothetical protein JNK94_07035 [Hyphomonadaceae bacterium]|nr:hypothetical protein [Hyphomonadaceae bacterium]